MVGVWIVFSVLGFLAYCLIAGVCYVWFSELGFGRHIAEVPATFWPIVLIGPVYLGRRLAEQFIKRRELQKELDAVRRKKDEQEAADAMKEGYR